MKGYIINKSNSWAHAMKRSVGPGAKIYLNELYEQYGIKHGLADGPDFITWLRSVKLKDNNKWTIVIEEEVDNIKSNIEKEDKKENKPQTKASEIVTPLVGVKISVADIVGLSVRQARETLPKITDLTLLKYAAQEANQLAGKDSLCRILRKRIKELQIAR